MELAPAAGATNVETAASFRDWLRANLGKASIFPVVLLGAALVALLFLVRPFAPPLPEHDDTAALWSESMSRLGIEPLYPPQEDFHVGDLFAVVSAYDDEDGVTKEKGPNRPLLRKSVRVAHVNLRSISLGEQTAPRFAATRMDGSEAALDQEREEIDRSAGSKIAVSLVSFPSIIIRSGESGSASWADHLPFAGSRTLDREEVITIKIAESYEANPVAATALFGRWCAEDRHRFACSDQFARKIIAYTVDNDVLEVRKDKYIYRISLKLITKVYMTRQFEFHRNTNGKVGAAAGPMKEGASPGAEAVPSGGAAMSSHDEIDLGLSNVIYPRPVVFGFKAATFALEPSTPSPGNDTKG
ncbi:MAG: hypothetical protein JNL61_05135 [Rhizobiaceae bacterium]|nr:hypothetical protein [Rhizobiaceae bacterium]